VKLLKFLTTWMQKIIFMRFLKMFKMLKMSLEKKLKFLVLFLTKKNRSNHPINISEDYFRVSLYHPYVYSLIMPLKLKFSNENSAAHSLLILPK
jgi:hypothetical protein